MEVEMKANKVYKVKLKPTFVAVDYDRIDESWHLRLLPQLLISWNTDIKISLLKQQPDSNGC